MCVCVTLMCIIYNGTCGNYDVRCVYVCVCLSYLSGQSLVCVSGTKLNPEREIQEGV